MQVHSAGWYKSKPTTGIMLSFHLLLSLSITKNILTQIDGANGTTIISSGSANFSTKLQVLIMLPLNPNLEQGGGSVNQEWDRGSEILPGAQIAVKAINNDPHLLSGYELVIAEKSVDPCIPLEVHSNINAFVPFVNGSVKNNTVGVLGLFCDRLLRIFSPLAGRDEFGLFQLSGTTSPLLRRNRERYKHLNFIVPSEAAYYETLFAVMKESNWRRALVIDEEFFNMNIVRNGSFFKSNLDITYLEYSNLIFTTLREIRRSERNIVYVSVGARETANLLCAAFDDGLVWPHYMWILQEHDVSDLLKVDLVQKSCTEPKLIDATRNTILFKFQYKEENESKVLVDTELTYKQYLEQYTRILNESGKNLTLNKFANTLHDSVWALAFALNKTLETIADQRDDMTVIEFVDELGRKELTNRIEDSLKSLSFEGVSGRIQFNDDHDIDALVSITLISNHNNTYSTIGYYDQASPGDFKIDRTLLELPSDTLPNRYNRIPLFVTVLLIVIAAICLLLTTIMFILFVRYRKYSEIKATSPYFSMLMFIGTYFMLVSAVTQTVLTTINRPMDTIASAMLCGSVISGNVMGIDLIFSTLLLRMLRIYHIFSYFGKTGKIWSDKVLVVIVLSIVGGDVVLLLIWFNVDPFTVNNVVVYRLNGHPPHYEISQYCTSGNIAVWFTLIFGKVGILFAIVLFLAIKTRNIQRENFKDTKKVNIYIFITVLIIAMLIPVWFLLERTGNVKWTGIVIYAAFGATGLFCQLMLFVPKILPLMKKIRSCGTRQTFWIPGVGGCSPDTFNATTDKCWCGTHAEMSRPNSKDGHKLSTAIVLTNIRAE